MMSTLSEYCSRRSWACLLWGFMAALLVGSVLSVVVPPLKSPDEGDHVRRAYLFSQGYWLLESLPCGDGGGAVGASEPCKNGKSMSGGRVDNGLGAYLAEFYPRDGLERSETEMGRAHGRQYRWEHQENFVYAPGTGYYFPLIYAPQALGLAVARILDLSIDDSYYLARFVTLLSTLSVLLLAFRVYPVPAAVVGVFLLPISLFQAVSLSIDGFSMAWAALAVACFMRFSETREKTASTLFIWMAFSVLMVGASRAHLASMVLMLFWAAWLHRSRTGWAVAIGTTLAICVWYGVAIPSTIDLRIQRSYTIGDQLKYYLESPAMLLEVLRATLVDPGRQFAYLSSFVGEFFNLPLRRNEVFFLAALLGAVVVASPALLGEWQRQVLSRGVLIITAVSGAILAFLAMLLTWTPHPATVVEGVQGRYFLIPCMLLLLAFCSWEAPRNVQRHVVNVLLFTLFSSSLILSITRMLQGFYMPWRAIDGYELSRSEDRGELRYSTALSPGQSLSLLVPSEPERADHESPLQAIGVMLKTHGQRLSGNFRLTLRSESGQHQQDVSLAGAQDDHYFYFMVPPDVYKSAEISLVDPSEGVSIWTFSSGDETSLPKPCVILVFAAGQRLTPGCPGPEYR